jgi:hypothetical protein
LSAREIHLSFDIFHSPSAELIFETNGVTTAAHLLKADLSAWRGGAQVPYLNGA